MRYYTINLYQPSNLTKPVRTWSSFPNGKFDPSALDIEFDCQISSSATPIGGSAIRIHGVSLDDLNQSVKFGQNYVNGILQEGFVLQLVGGMGKGLPLANPTQSGPLLVGQIVQSFGQWQGTEMWLDLIVNPTIYSLVNPGNYSFYWPAGTTLQSALSNCLSKAHPGIPVNFFIKSITQNFTEQHFCATLDELGQYIKAITRGPSGSGYLGVDIVYQNNQITVLDGSQELKTIQINYSDLIGQPTWLSALFMQLKVVLRGDIQVGSLIKMPANYQNAPGATLFQPSANNSSSAITNRLTFAGSYFVTEVRHIGHFRSDSGTDWATIATCTPSNQS